MVKSAEKFRENIPNMFCDPVLLNIEGLYIPFEYCLTIKPGIIDKEKLHELQENEYDEAPVYDQDSERVWGLVNTEYLKELFEKNKPLLTHDPNIKLDECRYYIDVHVALDELLEKMAHMRGILLFPKSHLSKHETEVRPVGLMTISDLNRHPLRLTLYSLLAKIESDLATFVQQYSSDSWDWLEKLKEEDQVQILGYWELSKKKGVNIGPIAATTLSQLINIVARNKDFRQRLGFRSSNEYHNYTGKIPGLRNCIMHPVRPLILDQQSVGNVSKIVKSIMDLNKRIEKACIIH